MSPYSRRLETPQCTGMTTVELLVARVRTHVPLGGEAPPGELGEHAPDGRHGVLVGRIGQDEVEPGFLAVAISGENGAGVSDEDGGPILQSRPPEVVPDRPRCSPRLRSTNVRVVGAPRERLDPQRARPGEHVQHARADHGVAQAREQPLPDAV